MRGRTTRQTRFLGAAVGILDETFAPRQGDMLFNRYRCALTVGAPRRRGRHLSNEESITCIARRLGLRAPSSKLSLHTRDYRPCKGLGLPLTALPLKAERSRAKTPRTIGLRVTFSEVGQKACFRAEGQCRSVRHEIAGLVQTRTEFGSIHKGEDQVVSSHECRSTFAGTRPPLLMIDAMAICSSMGLLSFGSTLVSHTRS